VQNSETDSVGRVHRHGNGSTFGSMAVRHFCTVHGFVDPVDDLVPMCPECEAPLTRVGGTPVAQPAAG
jgi:hypothetical protein